MVYFQQNKKGLYSWEKQKNEFLRPEIKSEIKWKFVDLPVGMEKNFFIYKLIAEKFAENFFFWKNYKNFHIHEI